MSVYLSVAEARRDGDGLCERLWVTRPRFVAGRVRVTFQEGRRAVGGVFHRVCTDGDGWDWDPTGMFGTERGVTIHKAIHMLFPQQWKSWGKWDLWDE